jgi:multiple sugar transport system permease protein
VKEIRKAVIYVARYGLLMIGVIICIGPFTWIILSSFKELREITAWPPTLWPKSFTLSNYVMAWTSVPYARYLLNSFFVSLISTISVINVSCLAAYSLVVLKSFLSRIVTALILIGLIMPAQITFVPLFKLARTFGLIDTYGGLIVPYLSTAFGVFMMTSFLKLLPFSLVDAARIDGLSETGIVTRIVIPNVKSGIITLIIFNFQQVWKDFFWPLLLINKTELRTVPVAMAAFLQMESQNQGHVLAAAIISIIPLFIVYALFQKQFVQGASFSGLKM